MKRYLAYIAFLTALFTADVTMAAINCPTKSTGQTISATDWNNVCTDIKTFCAYDGPGTGSNSLCGSLSGTDATLQTNVGSLTLNVPTGETITNAINSVAVWTLTATLATLAQDLQITDGSGNDLSVSGGVEIDGTTDLDGDLDVQGLLSMTTSGLSVSATTSSGTTRNSLSLLGLHTGSGTTIRAINALQTLNNSGTVTTATGIQAVANNGGTATMTNAYGVAATGTLGGTATNAFTLWAGPSTGTITNEYGVYVSTLSAGTNKYPLYVAHTADPSYLLGGVKFSTSDPGDDTLNYFEEGTCTPTLSAVTPGTLSVTYTAQSCEWQCVGAYCDVHVQVQVDTISVGTASGLWYLLLNGIPASTSSNNRGTVYHYGVDIPASTVGTWCTISSGDDNAYFVSNHDNAASTTWDVSNTTIATTDVLACSVHYKK